MGRRRNLATASGGGFAGDDSRHSSGPYISVNVNKTVNKKLSLYGFVGSIFKSFDYDFGGRCPVSASEPGIQASISASLGTPTIFNSFIFSRRIRFRVSILISRHRPRSIPALDGSSI